MIRWENVRVNPETTLLTESSFPSGHRFQIYVSGLLCHLWATNVRRALEGLPGVVRVAYVAAQDCFIVDTDKDVTFQRLRDAVDRCVLARPVRRWLGR